MTVISLNANNSLFQHIEEQTRHFPPGTAAVLRAFVPPCLISDDDSPSYLIKQIINWGAFGVVYRADIIQHEKRKSETGTERRLDVSPPGSFSNGGGNAAKHVQLAPSGVQAAVKIVCLTPQGVSELANAEIDRHINECRILCHCDHPNIVRVKGLLNLPTSFGVIVQEYLLGSARRLYLEFGPLPEPVIAFIVRDTLLALQYLHSGLGVPRYACVHRDVKASNILIDDHCVCKLIDFGMATILPEGRKASSASGTVQWMAPEVLNPAVGHGTPADIWSLGMAVYEMATGQLPPQFSEVSEEKWPELISANETFRPLLASATYPFELGTYTERGVGLAVPSAKAGGGTNASRQSQATGVGAGVGASGFCGSEAAKAPTLPLQGIQLTFSKAICDFVAQCTQRGAGQRPSAAELLQHEFIVTKGMHPRPKTYRDLFILLASKATDRKIVPLLQAAAKERTVELSDPIIMAESVTQWNPPTGQTAEGRGTTKTWTQKNARFPPVPILAQIRGILGAHPAGETTVKEESLSVGKLRSQSLEALPNRRSVEAGVTAAEGLLKKLQIPRFMFSLAWRKAEAGDQSSHPLFFEEMQERKEKWEGALSTDSSLSEKKATVVGVDVAKPLDQWLECKVHSSESSCATAEAAKPSDAETNETSALEHRQRDVESQNATALGVEGEKNRADAAPDTLEDGKLWGNATHSKKLTEETDIRLGAEPLSTVLACSCSCSSSMGSLEGLEDLKDNDNRRTGSCFSHRRVISYSSGDEKCADRRRRSFSPILTTRALSLKSDSSDSDDRVSCFGRSRWLHPADKGQRFRIGRRYREDLRVETSGKPVVGESHSYVRRRDKHSRSLWLHAKRRITYDETRGPIPLSESLTTNRLRPPPLLTWRSARGHGGAVDSEEVLKKAEISTAVEHSVAETPLSSNSRRYANWFAGTGPPGDVTTRRAPVGRFARLFAQARTVDALAPHSVSASQTEIVVASEETEQAKRAEPKSTAQLDGTTFLENDSLPGEEQYSPKVNSLQASRSPPDGAPIEGNQPTERSALSSADLETLQVLSFSATLSRALDPEVHRNKATLTVKVAIVGDHTPESSTEGSQHSSPAAAAAAAEPPPRSLIQNIPARLRSFWRRGDAAPIAGAKTSASVPLSESPLKDSQRSPHSSMRGSPKSVLSSSKLTLSHRKEERAHSAETSVGSQLHPRALTYPESSTFSETLSIAAETEELPSQADATPGGGLWTAVPFQKARSKFQELKERWRSRQHST